jgi:integrase/recombinase XerD
LWLTRRGYLNSDPCIEPTLRFSGRHTRRPKGLTSDELDELRRVARAEPPAGSRRFWPARDRCVIEFLAGTGARTSELCNAKVADIDWSMERPILRIDGAKGNKNRDIPLSSTTVNALHEWLAEWAEHRQTRPELLGAAPLFAQNTGQPATTGWLDQLLRALARRANITLPVGAAAHAFRHTYGLTAALRGVPTNVLTQLLGHEDPRTTAIYTTATARSLISALDDAGLLD